MKLGTKYEKLKVSIRARKDVSSMSGSLFRGGSKSQRIHLIGWRHKKHSTPSFELGPGKSTRHPIASGAQTEALMALFDCTAKDLANWPGVEAYLCLLEQSITALGKEHFQSLLSAMQQSTDWESESIWQVFGSIAKKVRDMNVDNASLNDIVNSLQMIPSAALGTPNHQVTRAVFSILCLQTLGLVPRHQSGDPVLLTFGLDSSGSSVTQTMETARRPVAALFRGCLKNFSERTPEIESADNSLLYHSNLNYNSLNTIGNVQIVWVECVSSHLRFDQVSRTLQLFKHPTFAALCISRTSSGKLLESIFKELVPPTSTNSIASPQLACEIMLSFRLLFGQDRRSRNKFSTEQLPLLKAGNKFVDPLLELLCRKKCGRAIHCLPSRLWPSSCQASSGQLLEQAAYNIRNDFPIFGGRLLRLQEFNLRQQPSQIRDLWRDRRNPLQWYTFWAVLWIGGFSLFFALVQVLIAAAQLAVALEPAS